MAKRFISFERLEKFVDDDASLTELISIKQKIKKSLQTI